MITNELVNVMFRFYCNLNHVEYNETNFNIWLKTVYGKEN